MCVIQIIFHYYWILKTRKKNERKRMQDINVFCVLSDELFFFVITRHLEVFSKRNMVYSHVDMQIWNCSLHTVLIWSLQKATAKADVNLQEFCWRKYLWEERKWVALDVVTAWFMTNPKVGEEGERRKVAPECFKWLRCLRNLWQGWLQSPWAKVTHQQVSFPEDNSV